MKITKKSVNASLERLNYWRRYMWLGYTGIVPNRCRGTLKKVVADVNDDGSIRITDYAVGDAQEADHFYGGGTDITDVIVRWLREYDFHRSDAVDMIVEAICKDFS